MFLLDTDHIGVLQSRTSTERMNLLRRMHAWQESDFRVSIISFHEELQGWLSYVHQARTADRLIHGYTMLERRLMNFAAMSVLPTTNEPPTSARDSETFGSARWTNASRRSPSRAT